MKGFVKSRYLPAILAALVLGTAVFAGEQLIQGQDSNGSTRNVLVDSSGRVVTTTNTSGSSAGGTHGSCTCTNTTVGITATSVPASALSGRSTIAISMLTTGQTLYCCSSSTACTTTTGLPVVFNGVYNDSLTETVGVSCICSAAGCSVSSCECP